VDAYYPLSPITALIVLHYGVNLCVFHSLPQNWTTSSLIKTVFPFVLKYLSQVPVAYAYNPSYMVRSIAPR
jgi:hypothetical protein